MSLFDQEVEADQIAGIRVTTVGPLNCWVGRALWGAVVGAGLLAGVGIGWVLLTIYEKVIAR